MAEKIEGEDNNLDWIKWAIVAVIVAAGVYANSYFSAESLLVRTIGLLLAGVVAGWIAAQTEKGRNFINLCLEARVEIRKVVWPTRQETTRTTIVVHIVIMIVAIILFGLDGLLNWIISGFIT